MIVQQAIITIKKVTNLQTVNMKQVQTSESSMKSLNEELCIEKKDNGNKTKDYNYYENEIEKSEYNLLIPEQDFSNEISADCISPVVWF